MYSEDNKPWADDQPPCSEPQEQALDGGIADLEIILRVSQHESHWHGNPSKQFNVRARSLEEKSDFPF